MKRERIIVGKGTDYPLKGLLTLPSSNAGKVPAVVLVHGSGASNMDEQVYKLTPFKDLADGLAKQGIASVRYNKRTFVYGWKMRKLTPSVWDETVEDAIRATDLLKRDPRIDPDRVFIIGHSMGAMLAPRIDAEGGNYRGLILMAGAPGRLEEIIIRQLKQAGQSKGSIMRAIVRLEDRIFSKKFTGLYDLTDEEAKKKKFAGNVTLYYFKEMGKKTAVDFLKESEKPVLIMQGGKDFQALPSEDFAGFQEQLQGRKNVEYRLYENLNHLFVTGIYNDILKARKEYKVEQRIAPEVIDDIADFIKRSL